MNEDEIDDIVHIDEFQLDREWLRQPKLVRDQHKRLAEAKQLMERARSNVDVVKAELDREIRQDPEAYDLAKATEKGIEGAILLQPAYKKAVTKYIEARHDVDLISAVVTALEHKKRALESLVSLHGMDYFAEPRTRNDDDREALKRQGSRVKGVRPSKKRGNNG